METVRTARLKLVYQGRDITREVAPFVREFSVTDHAHGKADSLDVTFQDRDGLWKGPWHPRKGDALRASLVALDWDTDGDRFDLPLGVFEVDEVEASGPPGVVAMRAASTPVSSAVRREKKTRAWEAATFGRVCADIAAGAGLALMFQGADFGFDRLDQTGESDLAFLKRVAEANGFSVKAAEEKLIIFEGKDLETAPAVTSIVRGQSRIGAYSFKDKAHDVFRACRVRYFDPARKEMVEYVYTPPNAPTVGQTLEINRRLESLAEAERAARAELRRKNAVEVTGSFSLVGSPLLLAGVTVDVGGYGEFGGRYFVDKAVHSVDRNSGWRTAIEIHKVVGF